MTDRPDDLAEIEGTGTRLAGWAIAAIDGEPASPDALPEPEARQLRRVNDAIAALHEARAARAAGDRP